MRICMVAHEFPPKCGGVGHYVYYLSKNLGQRGHRVTVLSRGSWGKTYREEIDGISVYRVRFLPLYPFHLHVHRFFLNQQARRLESNFDIIHLHNPSIPLFHTSLPVVVTQHSTIRSFIKHLQPLDLFSLILKLSSKAYFSFESRVINRADRIIAISQTCAEELQDFYGVDNAMVITNGVDTNFFIPAKSSNPSSHVLYAGALTTVKGLPDLMRAATYVCQDYPDIKFILAGRGPMEKNLKGLARKLDLDDNFSFVGHISQHKLREYYQSAVAFVLPSYHEGLATVLLEAMSCGVPSVATSVAGNTDVVVDGETGFLTPPKSPQELAEAILKLLGDEKLRKTMGANARKRVEERYDWDIITNQTEEIYASLVS